MIADIDSPFQVVLQMTFEHCGTEQLRVLGSAGTQSIDHQIPKRATHPIMGRDIEADLGPM